MSLPPELTWPDGTEVDAALVARAFGFLYTQIRLAQAQQPDVARALADLQSNGLGRIAETLGPVYLRAAEIDAHLQALQAEYVDAGIVPSILAQAAASVDAKLLALGIEVADDLAAYKDAAAAAFALKGHGHAIGDVIGLQTALDGKRGASVELFTTGGTWTRASGLAAAFVVAIGGGGGGGGGATGRTRTPDNSGVYNATIYGGGGGGGGGRSSSMIRGADLPATATIVIGSGGLGGADGVNGTAGGQSSFGSSCLAGGGAGGTMGIYNSATQNGGAGGRGSAAGGAGQGNVGGHASNPLSLGAGGGGGGRYYVDPSMGPSGTISRGGLSVLRAGAELAGSGSSDNGPGLDIVSLDVGGGGGSGGVNGVGRPGGLYGGGGGGGGGSPDGIPRTGGNGAPGAVLILNIF